MFAANTMWGFMSPVSKFVFLGSAVTPFILADCRMAGAAALFWIASLFTKREKVSRRDMLLLFSDGVIYAGLGELMKWLDRNVIYPQQSIRRRKEGRVEVSFVVDVDGTVRDAYISRKLDPTLDRACLMAIRRMPRWEPGRVDGRVARVLVTLPVDFCLE